MSLLDLPVLTPAGIRAAEEALFDAGQTPEALMERVALGVADWLGALGLTPPGPLVALAGPGHNGADALAACRILAERGWRCAAFALGAGEGSARPAWRRQAALLARAGVDVEPFDPAAAAALAPAVILDGGLGIGGRAGTEGPFAAAVAWANAAPGACRLALDCPTGLSPETGAGAEGAFRAHHTLALGALTPGLLVDPALPAVGGLWRLGLGLAPPDGAALGHLLAPEALPPWPRAAHKGTRGTLLVLAGSRGMPGAAVLAASAALGAGAGLVVVAGDGPEVAAAVTAALPEVIALPEPTPEALAPYLARATALVAGPGWAASAPPFGLLEVARRFAGPAVLDAGALALTPGPAPRVLTPHPGEAARLLGCMSGAVQADRPGVARRLAEASGAVVALKGAATLVAEPGGRLAFHPGGTPLLATAGAGDVLAGVVGALLARGLPSAQAAGLAVSWHGQLAAAAEHEGMLSLRARDLAERFARIPLRAPLWAQRHGALERIR